MAKDRTLERDTVWIARVVTYLVYAVVVVTEVILLLGFVLLLFGASPSASFVEWAYRNLERAMAPFRGMFTPIELGTTQQDVEAVLDVSILFAMIVYGLVALGLRALIDWLTGRLRRVQAADAWDQQAAAQREAMARAQAPPVDLTQPAPAPAAAPGWDPAAPGAVPPPRA